MGAAVQRHVGKKIGLVNLTGIGTGNSDPYGHIVCDQVGQVILGAISGLRFYFQISGFIPPQNGAVDKKQVDRMAFFMGDFGKLETPGSLFVIIVA
jgi:hypothetical protein